MFQGKHSDITEMIIGAFFDTYNKLGFGFAEKIYEKALAIELRKRGLEVQLQRPIQVYYEGQVIGQYYADLLVNEAVIVELKSARQILEEYEAQLLNYLKATTYEVGLVLNFGPKPQHSRRVYDNQRKGLLTWLQPENS